MLLISRFEEVAGRNPDREFLQFIDVTDDGRTSLTYREADLEASRRARVLLDIGLRRGDAVGILQPNSTDWVLWYLGALKAGLVTVALNPEAVEAELVALITDSRVRIVVADTSRAPIARAARRHCTDLIAVLSPSGAAGSEDAGKLLANAPRRHLRHDQGVGDGDCVAVIFSSGTTGARPKAVQITNRQLVKGMAPYAADTGVTASDRMLLVTPILHSCTLAWGLTIVILTACTLVLTRRFSASRFWEHANLGRATFFWTMGSVIHILLQLPPSKAEARATRRLRKIFAAGIGGRIGEALRRWPGQELIDAYGLTESPGTLAFADSFDHDEPYACIGRPVSSVAMAIVDVETGKTCEPRQQGEITIDLKNGFKGYLNNPEATAEVVKNGVFHTGDLAYQDEKGRLFFVDRMKDIIRRGGKNISAGEVEQVMLKHPLVAEVAAVPAPDPILEERVAVFCVLHDPRASFGLDDVRQHCENRISSYRIPEHVFVMGVDEIPRTPTGKIAKFKLKQMLRQRAGLARQATADH